MTLNEMLNNGAIEHPGKIAIIYKDRKNTYRELDEITNRIANSFIQLGLKKGDRVAIMLPKIPELVFSYLGLSKCGGIGFPLSHESTEKTIRITLSETKPFSLITTHSLLPLFSNIPNKFKISPIIVNSRVEDKYHPFSELLKSTDSKDPNIQIVPEDVFYLNYTSGTTGHPRGAITTHANIFFNTIAAVEHLDLTGDDIHLCLFAPFSHPHEIFARPLYLTGTMVLLDTISPRILAETIRRHQVTFMMGLAPFYELLWKVAGTSDIDLSSLRIAESGGMLTSEDLQRRFQKRFGIPILPVWGSTETSGIAIANFPHQSRKAGSIGQVCKYYQVRVLDTTGREVPEGEVGNLVFSGPAVVRGYYTPTGNQPLHQGCFFSGDLARKDEDGCFYFLGRKMSMIKVGGWKVYPHEIEIVLASHPGIKEVAVLE